MRQDFRVARACVGETLRDFSWHEYAPFAWILGAHLLFLLLALNLAWPVGMATAGGLARALHGDPAVYYPAFFLYLPAVAAVWEAFLYVVPGSVLIPLALIRIFAPIDPSRPEDRDLPLRLRRAWPPTLIALAANLGLLTLWQWTLQHGPGPILARAVPGTGGTALVWLVSIVGAYVIAAFFLYVPILAIRAGSTLAASLRYGLLEGIRLFPYSLFFIFLFALPVLPILLVLQLYPVFIVQKQRPELIGIALMLYAVLISAVTYLTYAAAARLHWAGEQEGT